MIMIKIWMSPKQNRYDSSRPHSTQFSSIQINKSEKKVNFFQINSKKFGFSF